MNCFGVSNAFITRFSFSCFHNGRILFAVSTYDRGDQNHSLLLPKSRVEQSLDLAELTGPDRSLERFALEFLTELPVIVRHIGRDQV